MKCSICGMENRTEIEEKEQLFNRGASRKDWLAIAYVTIFGNLLATRDQISNQLIYVFLILVIFYWILISKASYSSASTLLGKRVLVMLNVCAVIASFIFSYVAVSYIIGLPGSGYSAGFLYFWLGVFGLGSIIGKSLVL